MASKVAPLAAGGDAAASPTPNATGLQAGAGKGAGPAGPPPLVATAAPSASHAGLFGDSKQGVSPPPPPSPLTALALTGEVKFVPTQVAKKMIEKMQSEFVQDREHMLAKFSQFKRKHEALDHELKAYFAAVVEQIRNSAAQQVGKYRDALLQQVELYKQLQSKSAQRISSLEEVNSRLRVEHADELQQLAQKAEKTARLQEDVREEWGGKGREEQSCFGTGQWNDMKLLQ